MHPLEREIDGTGFSGVVRIDRGGDVELARAYGLAHRGHEIPNTVDTRFATASGTKGFTAVTIASLVEEGALELSTTARSVLGPDLPLIRDDVTIEHLLSHRSGIGDYLDENAELDLADYLMPVPVHELATTEQFLAVLDGYDTAFPPGERFAYNNGGYVVLALIAERTSGVPFHELVHRRVCDTGGHGRHRVPALRRAPRTRRARVPRDRRHVEDERVPPAGARERRRRHLHHRRGRQCLLERPLRRQDRSPRHGGGTGAAPQRRAGGAEALRPRLLARPSRATS